MRSSSTFPAEIRRQLFRLRHGNDGIEAICIRVQYLFNADVIVAIDFLPFVRACPYGPFAVKRRVSGGQALLSVQNKIVGYAVRRGNPLKQTIFKMERIAAIGEEHRRADRKSACDARDQPADAVVIPNPPALKIRQLYPALVNIPHQIDQRLIIRLHHIHSSLYSTSAASPYSIINRSVN